MLTLTNANYEVNGKLYSMYENKMYRVIVPAEGQIEVFRKNQKDPDVFVTKSDEVEIFLPARAGLQIEDIQIFTTKLQIAKKTALEVKRMIRAKKRNQISKQKVQIS